METMEKISVSDLSVGDYIRVKMCKWDYDDPDTLDAKVLSIEGNSVGVGYDNSGILMSAFVDDLQPIPITAEVLEKNGVALAEDYDEYSALYTCPQFSVVKYGNSYTFEVPQARVRVEYIHQLQHAIKLAGIEKEIIL